ncbi:MAG: UDP-N-acetylmuramate dehydrogenase [Pedosphaera sp.]|nr:UDP-N-acetylmuramate dehydrogenase [Pedosphaera sp.]
MNPPLRLAQIGLDPASEAALNHAETLSNLFRDFELLLPKGTFIRRDEPLAKRTTLRVGGPADLYVEPSNESSLALIFETTRLRGLPVAFLGRGSNLLIRDGGIRGVVISLAHPHFSRITIEGQLITADAGARLKDIAHEARKAGLSGLEFFEGIPGSLGGALRMNAGAMNAWTFDAVERLRFMDSTGEIHDLSVDKIPVEYRACPLLRSRIALSATLRGTPDASEAIQSRMKTYTDKRWTTQPKESSAGCTFKNPLPTLPAGRLIDELGLKGTRIGNAEISTVHGNFLVNLGNATSNDVLSLISLVQQKARSVHQIELETEVEILGEDA